MIIANKERLNELYKLENEYFELKGVKASETTKCKLRGELVKGFVKNKEMVEEAIEKISKKIEELKLQKSEEKTEKRRLPAGVIEAKFDGFDSDTGERIRVGDWIVRTSDGWSKIDNAF